MNNEEILSNEELLNITGGSNFVLKKKFYKYYGDDKPSNLAVYNWNNRPVQVCEYGVVVVGEKY